MNVGDYVRTKDGRISKIEDIVDGFVWFDNFIYYTYSGGMDILNIEKIDEYIIKSSSNIIDLIEVGDYVNGQQVNYVNKKHKEVYAGTEDITVYEKNIKSIVTKEQFSQMEYKAGDDND